MNRIELHLHTKLSDDVSVITPKEALEYAVAHSHRAVAFTNLNNVQDFPAIADAYRQCGNSSLKVIYGAEIRYTSEEGKSPYGITLLAKNQSGIKELYKIISSISFDGVCELASLDIIKRNRKNLLIGSCGNMGELFDAVVCGKNPEKAAAFYDYFEIYPTDDETERKIYKKISKLGNKLNIPVAAVGNCKYLIREDEICRRVIRVANGHEQDSKNLFYHTTDEMIAEFSYLGKDEAYKSAVTDTNRIADLIAQAMPLNEVHYPLMIKNAYRQVQEAAYKKAKEIYGDILPSRIAKRLQNELTYINKYDYAVHYLIARQMVKHTNELGYCVGARGAVGSTLVAFLLGVTDINPLPPHYHCGKCYYTDFEVIALDGFDLPKRNCPVCGCSLHTDGHDIPYETFMGIDGSKKPEIALNFPVSKKSDELSFLQELLGADRVAHTGTTATLWEKIAERYITIYESETNDYFTEEQRSYICKKLCGIKRRDGIHPAGVVVLPQGSEFEDFTPINKIENSSPIKAVTHFAHNSINGNAVKLNIIAHSAPDMLKQLEDLSGVSTDTVDWNDPNVYSLFEHADTFGIPEFSRDFMKKLLLIIKPKSFSDLVQISGIAHGTGIWIDNGENLLNKGKILGELPTLRDDVFLQLTNYGLDRESSYQIAECVRRGKLFHNSDLASEFAECMRNKNVPEWYIESLTKIRYVFQKAHAVSYVMNAIRMAWYKVYYPVQFRTVYMAFCDIDN